MKRDTIAIPLSHVKRYFGRQHSLFDEHYGILDPFQILAEVNRMLVMLPGSLDFVMPLMHSNGLYLKSSPPNDNKSNHKKKKIKIKMKTKIEQKLKKKNIKTTSRKIVIH